MLCTFVKLPRLTPMGATLLVDCLNIRTMSVLLVGFRKDLVFPFLSEENLDRVSYKDNDSKATAQ